MTDLNAYLQQNRDTFASAFAEGADNQHRDDEMVDGEYIVEVKFVNFTESKAGHKMVVWELDVAEGPFRFKALRKYSMFTSAKHAYTFSMDLTKCGVTPNYDDAIGDLEKVKGTKIHVKYTTNKKDPEGLPRIDFLHVAIPELCDNDMPF